MIVLKHQFLDVLHTLSRSSVFSRDTETFGLNAYKGDRLFSIIIHDGITPYYFNFLPYPNVEPECILPYNWCKDFNLLTERTDTLWYEHNAKFDEHMLQNEGIFTKGEIHCTETCARIIYNDYMGYSLEECAERIGEVKDDTVEKYIDEHHLWVWDDAPGAKTKRKKKKFYNKVPLSLMQPYGERDGLITFKLGEWQRAELKKIAGTIPPGKPTILNVYENEKKFTKTAQRLERRGIRINRKYCEEAIEYETNRINNTTKKFKELTGLEFADSNKLLAEAFTKLGEKFPKTEKGNPSFTDDVLESFSSPVAKVVQEYRDAIKRCNTYFRSFLYHADSNDRIHFNLRQAGTKTGRCSATNPNLQTLSKDDGGLYPVKRAFIPGEGFVFYSLDYDQVEYRLMLEYAREIGVIDKIKNEGLDVHEATAQTMGVLRDPAKTLNFMLLYGGGDAKLAAALKIPIEQARKLRYKYFEKLPNVVQFSRAVIATAEKRKFVFNILGRMCHYPRAKFCYKAPNHIIQGSAGDIMKIAMNQVDDLLIGRKSGVVLQVHDSLELEIHESEQQIVWDIKEIMESAYKHKLLPLTVSVSRSEKSLGDLEDVSPKGDAVQSKSEKPPQGNSKQLVGENSATVN